LFSINSVSRFLDDVGLDAFGRLVEPQPLGRRRAASAMAARCFCQPERKAGAAVKMASG